MDFWILLYSYGLSYYFHDVHFSLEILGKFPIDDYEDYFVLVSLYDGFTSNVHWATLILLTLQCQQVEHFQQVLLRLLSHEVLFTTWLPQVCNE